MSSSLVRSPMRGNPQVSQRRALGVGGALAALALLVSGTVLLIVSGPNAPLGNAWGFRGFLIILSVAFAGPGAVLAIRVPGNRVGTLMLGIGVWASLVGFIVEYAAHGIALDPGSLPAAELAGWAASWAWVPFGALSTSILPLIFPDGRLLTARWRWVAGFSLATIVLLCMILSVRPGPIDNAPYFENPVRLPESLRGLTQVGTGIGFLLLAGSIALSAASLVIRYRRSAGVARQQLKWFAAAGVFAGFTLLGPGTLLNYLVSGDPTQSRIKATEILTIFAIGTIPVATGVAILRYRLYDIDRILSRTVAWAGIMVVLVATFVGLVIGLQALLEPITGGGTLAVAGSTLVVAAATQPLARRVQAGVDRRFFRGRYDAARTVDSFAGRLRSEVDLQSIEHDVHATLSGTVNPVHVAVWIRAAKDRWSMAAPDLEAVRSPDGAVDMSRNVPDATERPVS